ncbi:MAG: hypothetical protein GQ582_02405, partial [Methyloprofundus sp.]|nr:hypothetical protein [Methyloprofundus sp.]
NYEFIIPTDDVLNEYNFLYKNIISSISNLVKQNQHLKEARDILLPRLMTGMIDVDSLALADPVVNKARPTESAYNSEASINPSVPTQSITAM